MISCTVFNHSTVIDIFITPPFIGSIDYKKKKTCLIASVASCWKLHLQDAATHAPLICRYFISVNSDRLDQHYKRFYFLLKEKS